MSAITGELTPALSIPIAAAAALLFKCVKVTDTYKSVDWPAVATVGGMISFGFALEKTGAAAALAHAIVSNFQWAGPGLILGAMLLFTVTLTQIIENAAVAIIFSTDRPSDCARKQYRSKTIHDRVSRLHFHFLLHAGRS